MRSWVTRATPAMATTTPPPTAAISRAIPSGMVPVKPRKWTSTFVEFCRMKTISRIRTRSAAPVATQTALARVSRGAPGAGGEPSPKDGVSVDPSSDGDEGGGPAAMIPTFLASRWPQQNILIVARDSRRDKALDMPVCLVPSGRSCVRTSARSLRGRSGQVRPLRRDRQLDGWEWMSQTPATPCTASSTRPAGIRGARLVRRVLPVASEALRLAGTLGAQA
jgi:hypothetical protein